jgi:hypothetical protein
MKKLLLQIVVFAALTVFVVFMMNRNYFPSKAVGSDGFLGAIVDKHAYADKTNSPRIIFCGGSNVAFGIDSKAISKEMGMPVVNLGLNASLGLQFMLNEAKAVAHANDIVVVSPEYYLLVEGDYKYKKEAERIYPIAGNYFNHTVAQYLHDFFIDDLRHNFFITFSNITGHQIRRFPTNVVYSRSSFNENGDVAYNYSSNPSHAFVKRFVFGYQKNPDTEPLNKFKEFADLHHFKAYFLYPCLDWEVYKNHAKVIQAIHRDFKQDLKMEMLNLPEESVFPDSLFYDTEYHLNSKGKQFRAKSIINFLKAKNVGK